MSLEALAVKQYELRQEQERLTELKANALSKCLLYRVEYDGTLHSKSTKERTEHIEVIGHFTSRKPTYDDNCYSMIIDGLKEHDEYYGFDEALFNYGCEHCNNARKLKRELGAIGTKLGQIRGQITRYGKRLSEAKE